MLRRTLSIAAVLLLLPATASAATLSVTTPGGETATVDLATLDPDVRDVDYDGERLTGVSLARALQDAGVTRADAGGVTVGDLALTRDAAFPADGSPVPVLVAEGAALRLVVPGGRMTSAADGTLAVTVAAAGDGGDEFDLTVSPRRPDPGERVRVSVAAPVAGATYTWSLDGRDVPATTSLVRTFRADGRHSVQVLQEGTNRYGSAQIVVGDPEPADDDACAGKDDTRGGASGENCGAAAGGAEAGGDEAAGGAAAGGGGAAAGGGPAAPVPVPSAAASPSAAPSPTAAPAASPTSAAAPAGQRVEGELLGGAVLAAQAVPVGEVEGADDGGGFRLPTGVWVAGAVLLLGWFGWGLDMLRARPRWS